MSKRMMWLPVKDGEATSYTYVDNGGKLLGVFAGDDYSDWYATDDLPDNIRLCRQVEADGVTVPSEVREAIRVCASYGMPLGITYAEYNGARDKVIAWLNEMEAQTDEPA